MTDAEKKLLSQALDSLWGAVNACGQIAEQTLDHRDARVEEMNEALCKAQDSILGLNALFGIEK